MNWYQVLIIFFIILSSFLAFKTGKLTRAGALAGVVIGFIVYFGAGLTALILMGSFFILGTTATHWKRDVKRVEKDKPRAGSQVVANSGMAAILAFLNLVFILPDFPFMIMIACVFSAATADTISSELGTIYGERFYNILTFQKDRKGLDGVVSVEGSLLGVAGSCIIALIFCCLQGSFGSFAIIVIAGTAGNLADSILGAALERKGRIGNDLVNFLNTLVAAGVGLMFL